MSLSSGGMIPIHGDKGMSPQVIANLKRRAQAGSGGFTDRVAQYRHNPFRQNSNLEIPSEYTTRNTYKRHFFKTNPIVGNAIELHSEFPLSDIHLEHDDEAIEEFLNDMLSECNFFDHLLMAAIEYWLIGEFDWFSFYDDYDNPSCYSSFLLLDQNKVEVAVCDWVQGTNREVFHLHLDKSLQQIIRQGPNHPVTGKLYCHLPSDVVAYGSRNLPMPLSPLQVSRVKRGTALVPRGESMLERIFPLLMYKDKLRSAQQCHDEQTECLTKAGWKKYWDLSLSDEIATYNRETQELEYQLPTQLTLEDYEGEMVHFGGGKKGKVDILVTPNHRMWARRNSYSHCIPTNNPKVKCKRYSINKLDEEFKIHQAFDVGLHSRVLGAIPNGFKGEEPPATITIGKITYDYLDYVKLVGYYVSEGSNDQKTLNPTWTKEVSIWQYSSSKYWDDICTLFEKYGWTSWKSPTSVKGRVYIRCNDHALHFGSLYGYTKYTKHLSPGIKGLPQNFLLEVIDTATNGDGTRSYTRSKNKDILRSSYGSVSEDLVNDLQEVLLKCGIRSIKGGFQAKWHKKGDGATVYSLQEPLFCHTVCWGEFPEDYANCGNDEVRITGRKKVPYKGKVWCVSVPNQIFITRRNGRLAIQGNSIADRQITPVEIWKLGETGDPADQEEIAAFQEMLASQYYDINKSIIFHHAIAYEACGTQGKMMNLWPEFDSIDNEICAGLLINKGLLFGDSSTFASDIVRYDILINRYLIFRNRIEQWLLKSIVGPILKIHEIYVPESKVKSMAYREMCGKGRPLAYPKVRWEKQSLRDENARMQLMTQMVEKRLVPESTLVRMLGLNPITARDKVEKEAEDKAERHQAMAKRLSNKGIPITPELAAIIGMGDMGAPPAGGQLGSGINISSDGGGGWGSAMPGLPNVLPGGNEGTPADSLPNNELPGAPPESQGEVGAPVG